jgi:outer membrane protein TolC
LGPNVTPAPLNGYAAAEEPIDDLTETLPTPPADDTLEIPESGNSPQATPVSLASILELATEQNPQVNVARERVIEAFARLERSETFWLPSIRAGVNYNKHEGRI